MTSIWKNPFTLHDLQKRCESTLASHLGMVFTEIGKDFLVAEMPIESYHLQPDRILHGGASAAFAETIASVAANCAVNLKTHSCVGLDLNINHVRAARSGKLIAKTFPYHIGRSTHVWSIEIHDNKGKLIAIARLTVAVLELKIDQSHKV